MTAEKKIIFYRDSNVVSSYNLTRFASNTGQWVSNRECFAILDLVRNNTDGLCLDVACGQGRLTSYMQKHGFKILGVDSSHPMLATNSDFDKVAANAFSLPFKDNMFPTIVSLRFLFHLENLDSFFKETSRVIKPKGLLSVDIANWTPRILFPFLNRNGGSVYSHFQQIKMIAAKYDLNFVRERPLTYLPSSLLKFLPLKKAKKLEFLWKKYRLPVSRYAFLFEKGEKET